MTYLSDPTPEGRRLWDHFFSYWPKEWDVTVRYSLDECCWGVEVRPEQGSDIWVQFASEMDKNRRGYIWGPKIYARTVAATFARKQELVAA